MSKVFIGIPMHKGELSAQTMESVFRAWSKENKVNHKLMGLSLLAKNFNMLFIEAVMKGYDYFLLHHSDLGVTASLTKERTNESWVDLMIKRLDQYNLKALSVAVAIKSPNGLTSSGILTVPGDAWSLRRTTVKELESLPTEIITRDDLCKLYGYDPQKVGALLINSGLLIMDIRNRGGVWREKKWPGFNIYDVITWNTKGIPDSFTIPEDWWMSMWCHDNGVPYSFTREFVISHAGANNYLNIGKWGDEKDCPRQQLTPKEYEKT